jgi:hypothetical protein
MYSVIRHKGIRIEDANATYFLNASITSHSDIAKPVSLDATANFTIGLAADGAQILGALESYEDRTQEGYKAGAVAPLMYTTFEYSGTDPVIGQWVVGDGTGKVKASATIGRALVEGIDTTGKLVHVTFM